MTSEQQPFPDYYEVLGARPDSSDDELRRARRDAVKRWHPDRNFAPEAEEMMRLVNAAWEVLGTPETRAEYDAVYFAWRAAEYARRATAADEVRRGYVRDRLERDERERREGGSSSEVIAGESREEGSARSAGEKDWGSSSDGRGSNGERDHVAGGRDSPGGLAFGIVIAALVAVVIVIIAVARAGSESEMRSAEATASARATRIAPVPTSTPSSGSIRSILGNDRIECDWVPIGGVVNFWSSATFRVPTTTSWSVGFLYHNPVGHLDSDAATYVYKNRSSGPYAGHWTRKDDAVVHRDGPVPVRPASALKTSGDNTLRIEVNERGSYLILNGELQILVPVAQLIPVNSRVQFCVGLFNNEASEYELRYSSLTGGTR